MAGNNPLEVSLIELFKETEKGDLKPTTPEQNHKEENTVNPILKIRLGNTLEKEFNN